MLSPKNILLKQTVLLLLLTLLELNGCAKATPFGQNSDGSIIIETDSGTSITSDATLPDAVISPPDASDCPKSPCALVEQCGCEIPQVCDLDSANLITGATACRDVLTPGKETATCTSAAGCAGGYTCIGNPGSCKAYCYTDADCNGAGSVCAITLLVGETEIPGAKICTTDCLPNLASNNGCATGFGCHIYLYDPDQIADNGDEKFITECDPAPASGGGNDASCTAPSDCQPGYDCVNVDSVPKCKQTCTYPGGTCAAGQCQQFSPSIIVGTSEYGVCI